MNKIFKHNVCRTRIGDVYIPNCEFRFKEEIPLIVTDSYEELFFLLKEKNIQLNYCSGRYLDKTKWQPYMGYYWSDIEARCEITNEKLPRLLKYIDATQSAMSLGEFNNVEVVDCVINQHDNNYSIHFYLLNGDIYNLYCVFGQYGGRLNPTNVVGDLSKLAASTILKTTLESNRQNYTITFKTIDGVFEIFWKDLGDSEYSSTLHFHKVFTRFVLGQNVTIYYDSVEPINGVVVDFDLDSWSVIDYYVKTDWGVQEVRDYHLIHPDKMQDSWMWEEFEWGKQ